MAVSQAVARALASAGGMAMARTDAGIRVIAFPIAVVDAFLGESESVRFSLCRAGRAALWQRPSRGTVCAAVRTAIAMLPGDVG
jgi:hypothetical protein